jgi:hypothetical protein
MLWDGERQMVASQPLGTQQSTEPCGATGAGDAFGYIGLNRVRQMVKKARDQY